MKTYDEGYSAGWADCFEETRRRFFAGELGWTLPCSHTNPDGTGTWEYFEDKNNDLGGSFFCDMCGIRQQETEHG